MGGDNVQAQLDSGLENIEANVKHLSNYVSNHQILILNMLKLPLNGDKRWSSVSLWSDLGIGTQKCNWFGMGVQYKFEGA